MERGEVADGRGAGRGCRVPSVMRGLGERSRILRRGSGKGRYTRELDGGTRLEEGVGVCEEGKDMLLTKKDIDHQVKADAMR